MPLCVAVLSKWNLSCLFLHCKQLVNGNHLLQCCPDVGLPRSRTKDASRNQPNIMAAAVPNPQLLNILSTPFLVGELPCWRSRPTCTVVILTSQALCQLRSTDLGKTLLMGHYCKRPNPFARNYSQVFRCRNHIKGSAREQSYVRRSRKAWARSHGLLENVAHEAHYRHTNRLAKPIHLCRRCLFFSCL